MADATQPDQRRSNRVLMRVPVELRCVASDGAAIEESTHTEVVGTTGAMVMVSCALLTNTEVLVTNRFSQQTSKFRVAWLGKQHANGLWEVGIEASQPLTDFWGVRFPPKSAPSS